MSAPADLVNALAKAQGAFPPIEKSQENKHFGSKYADLAAVLNAVRPVLADNGLAIVQLVVELEQGTSLVTKLLHESGELESTMPLSMDGLTSQQIGSMMTYSRRYAALAICGVHPEDDDDDGHEATQAGPRTTARSSEPKLASEAQRNFAQQLLDDTYHHTIHAAVVSEQVGRATTVPELLKSEATGLINWLKDEKKRGVVPEEPATPDGEPWDAPAAGSDAVESPSSDTGGSDDRAHMASGEAAATSTASGPVPPRNRR